MLNPSDVGIILSYRCQAACKHCLYNCGPGWQEWMAPKDIRRALEAVTTWPQPVQVHVTGGEPFLKFERLLLAIRTAAELGIPRYVETNAGWCVDEDLVERRLTALRDAGLGSLLISCSPFHAETIPPSRTRRAYRQALDVLGPGRVTLYIADWLPQMEQFGRDAPTPIARYVEAFGARQAGHMFWRGYGLISGGRSGYRLGRLVEKRPARAFGGQTCAGEILYAHHSHLDLYGNYISGFCGGLTVGDWHDLPRLRAEFRAGRYPPLVEVLIQAGPFGLYELACAEFDYEPLAEGYAGKCHLCVDVRRALAATGEFAELQPGEFYQRI